MRNRAAAVGLGAALMGWCLVVAPAIAKDKKPRRDARAAWGQPVKSSTPVAGHGGIIGKLGDGWVELVKHKTGIEVWMLDAAGKVTGFPPGAQVTATLRPENRPESVLTLGKADDHLKADLDLDGVLRMEAIIELRVGAKISTAKLRWQLSDNKNLDDTELAEGLQL